MGISPLNAFIWFPYRHKSTASSFANNKLEDSILSTSTDVQCILLQRGKVIYISFESQLSRPADSRKNLSTATHRTLANLVQ